MLSSSCDSVESFPGSRNNSRTAERDWDNGSTASSITSMAEYTGEGTPFIISAVNLYLSDCLFPDTTCVLFSFRSQTVQGAQRQVQQADHPQCDLPLLPGWKGQRASEEPDPRRQFSTLYLLYTIYLFIYSHWCQKSVSMNSVRDRLFTEHGG